MIIKLLILGGYGQFIWPAFIFTFASCSYLYFKTRAELKKQEKIFLNKIKRPHTIEIKITRRKETIKEVLPGNLV